MKTTHVLAMSVAAIVVSASQIAAHDLSRYREFQVGMSLAAVAAKAEMVPETRVLQQRPALIQEVTWRPSRWLRTSGQGDSVKTVLFSFYNGGLFRMVVTYDRDKTEGLTADDMVDALSAIYGLPLLPGTHPMSPAPSVTDSGLTSVNSQDVRHSQGLEDEDTILARWGDAESSVFLFRAPYQKVFGLVVLSKPIDGLARVATAEGARLDVLEAPQREIDRQQKLIVDNQAKLEAARRANRETFRP